MQQGIQASLHVVRGNSGFRLSHYAGESVLISVEGYSGSFRLVAGNMMFLLSLDGDLGIPLEWEQGSQYSFWS